MTHASVYANEVFFWGGRGVRIDVKSWTGDIDEHAFASYMKYCMSAMLRWCMQHYGRNSLYWKALIFLFKIQMTQYWSLPDPHHAIVYQHCSNHDWLHKGTFLFTGSEFLITFKNLPQFMKPKGSLPCTQQLANWSYPDSDQSTSCPPKIFYKNHFNIILQISIDILSDLFPSEFQNKKELCISLFVCLSLSLSLSLPAASTYLAHLILLNIITLVTVHVHTFTCKTLHDEFSIDTSYK